MCNFKFLYTKYLYLLEDFYIVLWELCCVLCFEMISLY